MLAVSLTVLDTLVVTASRGSRERRGGVFPNLSEPGPPS